MQQYAYWETPLAFAQEPQPISHLLSSHLTPFFTMAIGFEASKGSWSIDLNVKNEIGMCFKSARLSSCINARWKTLYAKWEVLFCTPPLECRQTIPTVQGPNCLFSVGNLWISLRCFLHNSGTLEKSFEGRSEGILGPHDNRGPMH